MSLGVLASIDIVILSITAIVIFQPEPNVVQHPSEMPGEVLHPPFSNKTKH